MTKITVATFVGTVVGAFVGKISSINNI